MLAIPKPSRILLWEYIIYIIYIHTHVFKESLLYGGIFLFVVTTSSLFDNGQQQQQTQTTGCCWFLQRQQKVLFGGQETSINPWKPVRTIVQTWQDKWDSNETASCSLSFCLQTGTDWLHLAHCCCGLTYIHTKSGWHTGKSIYTGSSV